jgi:hypothetical protein
MKLSTLKLGSKVAIKAKEDNPADYLLSDYMGPDSWLAKMIQQLKQMENFGKKDDFPMALKWLTQSLGSMGLLIQSFSIVGENGKKLNAQQVATLNKISEMLTKAGISVHTIQKTTLNPANKPDARPIK